MSSIACILRPLPGVGVAFVGVRKGLMANVLVVDDDDDVCELLETLLTGEGHSVRRAENGRRALELLDQQVPCLILLDLMMPVMDGFEFRRRQRQHPVAGDVPVVVVSARHNALDAARSLDAVAVMTKPFEVETLLDQVRRHCRR